MVDSKKSEEIKNDFITIASHQLRTPIAGIRWSLDTLLSKKTGVISEKQREVIKSAYESNNYLVKAVNDLLRAARLEEKGVILAPKLTDIGPIVKNIVKQNYIFARAANCRINLKSSPGQTKAYVDPLQIKLVIESLIDNAVRYIREKGKIEISLKTVKDFLILTVKDNGIGIPLSEQPRVFSRFFRASNAIKTQTEGLGLDLYINKKIIDASGGRFNFTSTQGRGTTFYVYLPLNSEVATKNKNQEANLSPESELATAKTIKKEREFVAITVHELKAPLGATKWSLEMLKSGKTGQLSSDQLELVDQIYRGNERLLVLVRDLLDLSKLQEGEFDVAPKPLELKTIINDVATAFKAEAKRKNLEINLPVFNSQMPKVLGDQNRVAQVVTNLLSNAVKYTPEKGRVTIMIKKISGSELKNLTGKISTAEINYTENKKGYLVISVQDTGAGISAEEQSKLFPRFFRGKNVLKSKTEGTGLGLYITKTIVNLHQGDIWFVSQLGKGSTFSFSLPIA